MQRLLHPGDMGAALGTALREREADVGWASEGGETTRARASAAGLIDLGTVANAVAWADLVVSVSPPAAAPEVAFAVAGLRIAGLYLDAKAIAPATARGLAVQFEPGAPPL